MLEVILKGGPQLVAWGLRITTFLTNTLVLVGYALLYEWLLQAKFQSDQPKRLRQVYLAGMTIGFLLLFHFASIFSMAAAHNAIGVGWTYLNFQIATMMYALLCNQKRLVWLSLATTLLVWYWWLPHTPLWPGFYLATLILMWVAQRYATPIGHIWWCYLPFAVLFAAPFMIINYLSLRGIDVGWLWEVGSCLVLAGLLWMVHFGVKRQRAKTALLKVEARIDELTQLNNFRVFNEDLLAIYQQSQLSGTPFALYTFDIDHFKWINDRYGHLMGNQVLEAVATRMEVVANHLGYPDVRCYRTGGEEFSLIITEIAPSMQQAETIAWRIHDELGKLRFVSDAGQPFQITISLGEDRSRSDDQNYLDVYNRADQYLYNSKRAGRNTVTINGQTLAQR